MLSYILLWVGTVEAAIPLVDLKIQYRQIQADIDGAIQRTIESADFIMGPDIGAFEEEFAAYCGAEYCIGVSSGTSALSLSFRAQGVGPGDEVITVAHTFIATAEAISAVGARPVFVDIDPRTYGMSPESLAKAISARTKAVVPVHIYGQPVDMTRIRLIVEPHGIAVVEDAAQAHGARWRGRYAGSLGDAACFSFYPGKNLGAYGDAGAVLTNDRRVAEEVSLLRNHGRRAKYIHERAGYNERMDTLQAAILRAKLPHLSGWIEDRARLAHLYNEQLAGYEIELPHVAQGATSAWHLYVIRTANRDKMLKFLQGEGIGAGVHYPVPLHLQPAYADLGYVEGDLPATEEVARTCLSLPLYPEMTAEQLERVVSTVGEFLRGLSYRDESENHSSGCGASG